MKVEHEFLTNFLNLGFATEITNTEFSPNSRLKKALWYMASHNETILIFLELAHLGLYSGKSVFSILHDLS